MNLHNTSKQTNNSNNSQKPGSLEVIELAIVLIIKNFNFTIINLKFLQDSGVIPNDWQLLGNPVTNNFSIQLDFSNQVKILAENNRITFSESLKLQENPKIPTISCQLIKVLHNADYQSMGFNPNSLVVLNKDEDIARRYITEKLLRAGGWYQHSKAPVKASINYLYTLEESRLNLNVREATFQQAEQPTKPAILFTSNFHYDLKGQTRLEKYHHLLQILENWELILKENKQIIRAFFS